MDLIRGIESVIVPQVKRLKQQKQPVKACLIRRLGERSQVRHLDEIEGIR
jgi:hypothetical protein